MSKTTVPHTSGWIFERVPRMGGATGNAFSNTLQGTGTPSVRLVREAVQNSTDAGTGEKVIVKFRYERLVGSKRKEFIEAAELLEGFGSRREVLGFDNDNVLTAHDHEQPLGLLFIEDYGTTGLRGALADDTSDFHRLLLTIGDDQKAIDDQHASGGSYGYGKAVLSSNSRIRTVFAYSLAADKPGEATAKLLGCSYCSKHEHGKERFTGRSWFGTSSSSDAVEPFTADAAHSYAALLGFTPRAAGEYGTSILIVDCVLNIGELRHDTESYWWPRIIDDELEVDFSENGKAISPPRPKMRADLMPFIECYEMAVDRSSPVGKHQAVGSLKRAAGKDLGHYAFEVLAPNGDDEDTDARSQFANRIAILRKPKMVVDYLSGCTRTAPEIVGVFVADEAIDHYLKLSEPPDHTAWQARSRRLAKLKDYSEAVECIEAVHDRLRRSAKNFQAAAMPPPPKKGARLTRLEKALGSFFRTLGDNPPGGTEEPVDVEFTDGPLASDANGKQKVVTGEFVVKLKPKYKADEAEATIEVEVPVMEDGAAGELLPLKMTDQQAGSKHAFEDGRATITKLLKKHESYRFAFTTGPYDRQWSTSPLVKVTVPKNEV